MSLSNARVRATVAVAAMDRAASFYEGTLDLAPLAAEEGMEAVRIYECGGGSLLQVYVSEHAGSGSATAASWSAESFDEAVETLRGAGVEFLTFGAPATATDGIHTFGEHKVVWFTDPDGNSLALDNGSSPS